MCFWFQSIQPCWYYEPLAPFVTHTFKAMFLQSLMCLCIVSYDTFTPILFFICLGHIFLWLESSNFLNKCLKTCFTRLPHLVYRWRLLFLASALYITRFEQFNILKISTKELFFDVNLNIFKISWFVNFVAFGILTFKLGAVTAYTTLKHIFLKDSLWLG